MRLRDQGGLIVIDFIDMRNPQHISDVEKTLRHAMHEDKARHEVGRISHFGLLEVSRQRLRPAAAATSYVACPMCEGHGLVRTTESAVLVVLRKMHNRVAQGDLAGLKVSVPRDVALYLLNQKREDLAQLERRYGTRIQVVLREDLMPHQSEYEGRPRVEGEAREPVGLRLGGVAAPPPEAAPVAEAAPAPAAQNGAAPAPADKNGKRRRRRRGRRRGRGMTPALAIAEGLRDLGVSLGLAPPLAAATTEDADGHEDDLMGQVELSDLAGEEGEAEVAGEEAGVVEEPWGDYLDESDASESMEVGDAADLPATAPHDGPAADEESVGITATREPASSELTSPLGHVTEAEAPAKDEAAPKRRSRRGGSRAKRPATAAAKAPPRKPAARRQKADEAPPTPAPAAAPESPRPAARPSRRKAPTGSRPRSRSRGAGRAGKPRGPSSES